jgi:hypothetical protein
MVATTPCLAGLVEIVREHRRGAFDLLRVLGHGAGIVAATPGG